MVWGSLGARAFCSCTALDIPLTTLSLCRTSLPWHRDDLQHSTEPSSKVLHRGLPGMPEDSCTQPSPRRGFAAAPCAGAGREKCAVSSWQAQRWKQGQGWPCRHGEGHGTGSVLACCSSPRCLSAQCFAVRSLGWVEIPEEDLAPGKSSIAVNNCIQQLSNSKCQGQGSADNWGEVRAWGGAQSRYRVPSVPGDQCCWGWLSSHRGSGEPRELCRWQSQL